MLFSGLTGTTAIRALKEQDADERASFQTSKLQKLVHSSLTHTPNVARNSYIVADGRRLQQLQSHAALELAYQEGTRSPANLPSSEHSQQADREPFTLAQFLPAPSLPSPKARVLVDPDKLLPQIEDGRPRLQGRTVWSPQDVASLKVGYEKYGPRWRAIARDKALTFSPGIQDCGLKQRSNKLKSFFFLHKADFAQPEQ